jgi:hypothetical protein
MAAAEKFTELKRQVEAAESNVRAAGSRDEAELRAKVDEARKDADGRAARLNANVAQAADRGDRRWAEAQSDWDDHVRRIRASVDERKDERDAKRAERNAESAEADALDAIDYAAAAIEEAEYAVLTAALARVNADALAST